MVALREDPDYENTKSSRLLTALDAAVQIQKRKVVVGPYDSVGIMLYNTVRYHSRFLHFRW
jgi:ATP-dependent DNA helicase 2 subunit 1